MKKIMMLGGNIVQKSAIIKAKELGYYVISVDYLPDNPGHKYSDEYYNVSTIDKEAILELARKLEIDGILSYASDVSAPTAAYVAEQLSLPTNPYKSVQILTYKNLFRKFMRDNGLATLEGQTFQDKEEARAYFHDIPLPVMIKPIDSSGSKGVVKVTSRDDFDEAYQEAMSHSISGRIIIEHYVERKGYQISGDGFIKDGKIAVFQVMDQHKNMILNPFASIGPSCPSVQDQKYQDEARALCQTIFDKLHMRFGAFNFEYIIDENDEIFLLEIGPRNGGNLIPDTVQYSTGVDMIEASIRACMGDDYEDALKPNKLRCASSYVIHSMTTGRFKELLIHDEIADHIIKQELDVLPGDAVHSFRDGGDTLGAMVIAFDNVEQMNEMMDRMWEYIEVVTE